jgi:hypothetical protein
MKKIILSLLAAATLTLTACLDIVEEITLNADGSGKYAMSMDMSQMMQMMVAYMPDSVKETMDENAMMDSLANMTGGQEMDSVVNALNEMQGISHAESHMDGFVMVFSYDFANVEALNQAASQNSFTAQQGLKPANYVWKKGVFSRKFNKVDLGTGDEDTDETMAMAKMMMQEAKFKTVYNFPGAVKKASNSAAELSNGKKTVTVERTFGEIFDDPELMSNEIKFKSK